MNYDQTDQSMPNVQGFERTASIVGGVMLLGCGIRKGGLAGLIEMALGGMAIARGATGRCAMKRALCQACAQGECGEHSRLRRHGETPPDMSRKTAPGSTPGSTSSSGGSGVLSGNTSGTASSSSSGSSDSGSTPPHPPRGALP